MAHRSVPALTPENIPHAETLQLLAATAPHVNTTAPAGEAYLGLSMWLTLAAMDLYPVLSQADEHARVRAAIQAVTRRHALSGEQLAAAFTDLSGSEAQRTAALTVLGIRCGDSATRLRDTARGL